MHSVHEDVEQRVDERRGLLILALLALVVGAMTGLIGASFRVALEHADRARNGLSDWAHGQAVGGFIIVVSVDRRGGMAGPSVRPARLGQWYPATTLYGDVGGLGIAAHVGWQILATIDYTLPSSTDLHAGFPGLNFNYVGARAGFDVQMYGPTVSATFRF